MLSILKRRDWLVYKRWIALLVRWNVYVILSDLLMYFGHLYICIHYD